MRRSDQTTEQSADRLADGHCVSSSDGFARSDRTRTSQRVEELLHTSPYLALRSVKCEYDGVSIILRGRVPTFYTKQVAFTLIERMNLGAEIVDQIDVVPPTPRKPRTK